MGMESKQVTRTGRRFDCCRENSNYSFFTRLSVTGCKKYDSRIFAKFEVHRTFIWWKINYFGLTIGSRKLENYTLFPSPTNSWSYASLFSFDLSSIKLNWVLYFFCCFSKVRILKLAKNWSTMSSLLATIGHSLGALANLSVILAIIVYIFAVVGMQLFGSQYTEAKFGGEVPRWNFTDFWHSFLLIFRIICGEWVEPLWDCMRAAGPASIILFIPAFVLGHFIVSYITWKT